MIDQENSPSLEMWVIYYDPKDYPGKWVVRLWQIGVEGVTALPEPFVCDSLAEAREAVPPGCSWLDRAPIDEPQIKEIWL
jgi:hypothetical protein